MEAGVGCHREAVGVALESPAGEDRSGLLPHRRRDAHHRWHVLHVLSRHEKTLARLIEASGISVFLPLTPVVTYHGRHKVRVDAPLFPGYVFLWGDLDDAYSADRTGHVAAIIGVDDQDLLERELQSLHLALSRGVRLSPHPVVPEGTRVVIRAGPMKGLEGVVKQHHGGGRLILQVSMLGTAVSVDLDGSLLAPTE